MPSKPSSVKVGPHVYRILWSKESWKKYAEKELNSGDHIGLTLVRPNLILIQGWDMTESMQADTLLHEISHACFAIAGYSDLPVKTSDNSDTEEVLIRLLVPVLLQVLRENPHVAEYLVNSD